MIELRGLCTGYGKRDVLRDIHLRIGERDLVGILGPNGSGKTTLLLSIAGILPIRSGEMRVGGKDIAGTDSRQRARLMASVSQKYDISFPFRCLSLVLMGRYPYLTRWGGYSMEDMDAAMKAMEETETLHLAHRMISEVSGGEAQRIIIARSLAQDPFILLLDEATANLDVARKLQIFDLLLRKNTVEGKTILCAMHDLNLAALYCERLVFLKEGRIVLDGTTEETFTEESLSEVYETEIRISKHPVTGRPQAHFVPGSSARGARSS